MPTPRVEPHAAVARHSAVKLPQRLGHLGTQCVREGLCVGRQAEPLVAFRAAFGEVGRQIRIGIAKPVRARDPDFLAAQPFAQGLEHADFVVDAVHPLPAARCIL